MSNVHQLQEEDAGQSTTGHEAVALGGYTFDPESGMLSGPSGAAASLGHQASEVLKVLARRPGVTVSKDEFFSAVWGDLHVTENNLSQCIMQIRRAIDDRSGKIVRTVPKIGYRLVLDGPKAPANGAGKAGIPRWWLGAALGLAAILLVAVVSGWPLAGSAPKSADSEIDSADPASLVAARQASIAVHPFEDLTGEPRWKRLAQGLAIGLSGELARHPGLQVFANTSGHAARPDGPSQANPGAAVALVLDGSLQEQDGQVRLTTQLSTMPDAEVIWTESWTGAADDIFEWQDEVYLRVASSIASVWTGAISRSVLERTHKRPTDSLDAYELFLLGSEAKHKFTEEGLRQATEYLEAAVAIDPGYARAWVALDLSLLYLSYFADTREEGQEIYAKSVEARKRAYEADPNDPEVLVRYSGLVASDGDLLGASAMIRRGVGNAPSDADILSMAAFSAAWRGVAGPEPVAWAKRSLLLNKAPPDWYTDAYGMALFHDGQFSEAAKVLAIGATKKNDSLMVLAAAEALIGEYDLAEATAARLREAAPNMVAMDLVPTEKHLEMPSWQAFLEGARLAGVPIGTPDWEAQ